VGLKSTAKNPPHSVWSMYVCVEAPGQKTLSDNAGALGKSVKADINMIKGTREKKKSHHKNFGEI